MCSHLKFQIEAFTLFNKRNVFQERESSAPPAAAEKVAEAAEATSEDADAANTNLEAQKAVLQGKIDTGLKSDDPEVKAASQKANEQLGATESENLTPETIQRYLNRMTRILQFDRFNKSFKENKERIRTSLATIKEETNAILDEGISDLMAEHPDLSPKVINRLKASKANYSQTIQQYYDDTYSIHLNKTANLAKFLGNRVATAEIFTNAKAVANEIDMDSSVDESFEQYSNELQAIVEMETAVDASKSAKESENHINNRATTLISMYQKDVETMQRLINEEPERKMELTGQLEIANNKLSEIQMSQKETLARLAMVNTPEERALILAQFKDETGTTQWGDNFNPKYLKAMTNSGNIEQDSSATAIENGPSEIQTDDPDVLNAEGQMLKIENSTAFRMPENGVKLSTLQPGTKVQLVDTQVYYFETEEGKQIAYVKVKLNPPNGPTGFVGRDSAGITSQLPEEPPEELMS